MEQELRAKVVEAARQYYREVKADGAAGTAEAKVRAYIPAAGKMLGEEELAAMIEASLDMWLTAGRFADRFEQDFAGFLGAKYALATNAGSSANLLALAALTSYKLKERALVKGDEVITVAAAFPTTVAPIFQLGLVPVFVDCEAETCNIDAGQIEKAISPKTKAIFIAHTLGNPFDVGAVKELCCKYNLWLIEDACDALGTKYDGKFAGTLGDIGTFSFYPAHHMTMGEGGAVVTNNPELYRILMSFRDWGRDCWCKSGHDNTCKMRFKMQLGKLPFGYDHKYTYSHLGYNLRITDWQAAIGVEQLKKLPAFTIKRKENAAYLMEKLADLADYITLPKTIPLGEASWFGLLLLVKPDAPFTKQEMVEYAEENGVGTRQLFAGNILRQPLVTENDLQLKIQDYGLVGSKDLGEEHYKLLPVTEYIMNNAFWVGVFPALSQKELDKISEVIHNFVKTKI